LIKKITSKDEDECGLEFCGTMHGGWLRNPADKRDNTPPSGEWFYTDNTIDARYVKKPTIEVSVQGNTLRKKLIRPVVSNRNYRSYTAIQQTLYTAGIAPV